METNKTIETALVKDSYDDLLYSTIRDASDKVQEVVKNDDNKDVLVSDVFSSLYKATPTLRDDYKGFNKSLMNTMMGLAEYKTLRGSTKFDDICSALGTMKLAPGVITSYENAKKEMEKRQKEREKNKKNQKGQNQGKGGQGQNNDQGDNPGDEEGEKSQGEDSFDQDIQDQLRQDIRVGLQQAQDSSDEWSGFVNSWGISKDELARLPVEKKLELAEKIRQSNQFKAITDMAGRFKNMAQAEAAITVSHGQDEIHDVGAGSDLEHILPSEYLKLKKTPALFYKDFLEGSLQIYNLKGVENLGRGPIIVCMDISPSMMGQREEFAKAIILALMFLAEKQKRTFGVITFGSGTALNKDRYEGSHTKHVYKYFGQKATLEEKLDIASIQCNGGGTNFYLPLKAAFKMRQDNIANLNPADIIFITDGECQMQPKETAEIDVLKQETQVRIHGIAINDSSYGEICGGSTLGFCDDISSVNALGEIDQIKGAFTNTAALTQKGKKK